jgi:hypothetical protein
LETDEEEMQQSRLQRRSQPVDQMDRVIEEIRRLMLKSAEETVKNREKLIRGEPVVAVQQQQQQQQQQRRGVDGQLQIQVWDPGGSQPQQQGSHEQELMIFLVLEYDAGASLHLSKCTSNGLEHQCTWRNKFQGKRGANPLILNPNLKFLM